VGSEEQTLRRDALTAFLDARMAEGYLVESRTDTQAVIVEGGSFFARFRPRPTRLRQVVAVDAGGDVTVGPAVPLRS